LAQDAALSAELVAKRKAKALIGGSLEMRRLHGTPSTITGQFILDPIFRPDDLQKLRALVSAADPRPLVIEIGFQMGEFAAAFCEANPDVRYVGFEVRKKYCEEADALAVKKGIHNATFCLVDAREMLREVLTPGTLDQLLVFFPDPWWKPRHIKKRLLTADFVAEAATLLRPGGRLLLKTDVPGYADWAQGVMAADPHFATERLADPAAQLPPTLRERRCKFHGYPTFAVQATRLSD
jgi:tRNA (guanine-N(7)-)-methyltransferase